jgi:hypothetical protein
MRHNRSLGLKREKLLLMMVVKNRTQTQIVCGSMMDIALAVGCNVRNCRSFEGDKLPRIHLMPCFIEAYLRAKWLFP